MTVLADRSAESHRLTSAQRVLSILGAFDAENLALSLSEISRRSGLTLSTTHRLLNELCCWGALTRHSDGTYGIGLRILELGTLAPQGGRLREIALPYLHDLQHALRANIHLGVPDGHAVIHVESLRARDTVPVPSRQGGRWPLHATGTGLVLLAYAPQEFQDEVLARELRGYTAKTLTDPDELRRFLAEVRRTGVAVVESQLTYGVTAVAVPIRGPRDKVVAALGITVPSGSASPHALVPAMTTTARSISRALGAPSAGAPAPRPHGRVREATRPRTPPGASPAS